MIHPQKSWGVAVQSRYFSVGSIVPWAEAEVGAIATQSFVNVSYGPRGLELLKKGLSVEEVIERLTGEDEARDFRQLGIINSKGEAAAFTGKKCLEWAGSKTGKNFAAALEGGDDAMGGFKVAQGEDSQPPFSSLKRVVDGLVMGIVSLTYVLKTIPTQLLN